MAGKAEVKYDAGVLSAPAVAQLIQDLGFGAKLIEDHAGEHGKLDLTVSWIPLDLYVTKKAELMFVCTYRSWG